MAEQAPDAVGPLPAPGEAVPCHRLHGVRDMRVGSSTFHPPARGEVLLRIGAVGLTHGAHGLLFFISVQGDRGRGATPFVPTVP